MSDLKNGGRKGKRGLTIIREIEVGSEIEEMSNLQKCGKWWKITT